jgi:hypothetical protein
VNRVDLQKLANERIADAKILLVGKRWAAAYYLAGYAVECGLKSCILARVTAQPEVIFEDRKFSEKCWTHNLEQLLELANLKTSLKGHAAVDPEFYDNWEIVKKWSELTRYTHMTKAKADEMIEAIANKKHGVLPWIKQCW